MTTTNEFARKAFNQNRLLLTCLVCLISVTSNTLGHLEIAEVGRGGAGGGGQRGPGTGGAGGAGGRMGGGAGGRMGGGAGGGGQRGRGPGGPGAGGPGGRMGGGAGGGGQRGPGTGGPGGRMGGVGAGAGAGRGGGAGARGGGQRDAGRGMGADRGGAGAGQGVGVGQGEGMGGGRGGAGRGGGGGMRPSGRESRGRNTGGNVDVGLDGRGRGTTGGQRGTVGTADATGRNGNTRNTGNTGPTVSTGRTTGGTGTRVSTRQTGPSTSTVRIVQSGKNPFYPFPYSPSKNYQKKYYRVITEPTTFMNRYPWSWSRYFKDSKYGNLFYKSSGIPKISKKLEPGQPMQIDLGDSDTTRKEIGQLEVEFYGYKNGNEYLRSGVTARSKSLNEDDLQSFDKSIESFTDDLSKAFDDNIAAYKDDLLPPSSVWNSKFDMDCDLFADACAGFIEKSKEKHENDMDKVFADSMDTSSPFRNSTSYFVQVTSGLKGKKVTRKVDVKKITDLISAKTKTLKAVTAAAGSENSRLLQERNQYDKGIKKEPQPGHLVTRYLVKLFERYKASGILTPEQATRFQLCLLLSIFNTTAAQCSEDRLLS